MSPQADVVGVQQWLACCAPDHVFDAVAELIDAAALVHAQAKAGKELDLIVLADCIDNAGGREIRRATRAAVTGETK